MVGRLLRARSRRREGELRLPWYRSAPSVAEPVLNNQKGKPMGKRSGRVHNGSGVWFVIAIAVSIVPSVVSAAPGNGNGNAGKAQDFIGLWEGVDPLDGSSVQLSLSDVEGDGVLELTQSESFWSVCFDLGAAYSQGRGVVVGTGTVGNKGVLDVESQLVCIDDENNANPLPDDEPIQYTLHAHGSILRLPEFDEAPAVLLHRISE